jgi:hypothetical protein
VRRWCDRSLSRRIAQAHLADLLFTADDAERADQQQEGTGEASVRHRAELLSSR